MAKTSLTAEIATVKIGLLEIEGLLFSDGTFGVAIPQVSDLFLDNRNLASRDIKRILSKDIKTSKNITLNKVKTKFNRKAVNYLPLEQFNALVFELALRGNENAIEFSRNLQGLSLHQLFCDSFGIVFDVQDRQAWLVERMESKKLCRELTDAIKEYYIPTASENGKRWVYPTTMDAINRDLFGKSAKEIREEQNVKQLTRDCFGYRALAKLDNIQSKAAKLISRGTKPTDAVHEATDLFYEGETFSYLD